MSGRQLEKQIVRKWRFNSWEDTNGLTRVWYFEGFAAIIELFHLLPAAAGKFLDQLVTLTMQLEAALPPSQVYSELNSPYRLPLTKFLNRYAPDAVDYFLGRLTQATVFRR